ncbi:hypothetical protein A3K42_00165, partial [candidate division WWE3 bacterium RBG_13_37_7]
MIDIAVIKVKAGNGGDGKVSFFRERYVPKGGPDGGDGGNGGNVFFVASDSLATLIDFHSKPEYKANDGEGGGGKKMFGKSAEDLYVKVPVGTLIYEIRDGKETLIEDLREKGQTLLVAKGGKGGLGNVHFKSSVNQTPMQYIPGVIGEIKEIKLEVKLVADAGLIGLPNAGKSTLLNFLTNANAKVANYPFTTISPNLGVYTPKSGKVIVLSDIPGLIEGASKGRGLGDEFLRHVERTRILIHIVDPLSTSLEGETYEDVDTSNTGLASRTMQMYDTVRKELHEYGKDLDTKKEVVAINKIDVTEVREAFPKIQKLMEKNKITAFGISAVTGEGVGDLMNSVATVLESMPKAPEFGIAKPVKIYTIDNLPNKRMVYNEGAVQTKKGKP